MARKKDNNSLGGIENLSQSDTKILRLLIKHPLDNWGLYEQTGYSESTIIKDLRILRYRGLVIKEGTKNKIPAKLLEKLRRDLDG